MPAVVDRDECCACGTCVAACEHGAVTVTEVAVVDDKLCTECGACVTACPVDALTMVLDPESAGPATCTPSELAVEAPPVAVPRSPVPSPAAPAHAFEARELVPTGESFLGSLARIAGSVADALANAQSSAPRMRDSDQPPLCGSGGGRRGGGAGRGRRRRGGRR